MNKIKRKCQGCGKMVRRKFDETNRRCRDCGGRIKTIRKPRKIESGSGEEDDKGSKYNNG